LNYNVEERLERDRYETLAICRQLSHARAVFKVAVEDEPARANGGGTLTVSVTESVTDNNTLGTGFAVYSSAGHSVSNLMLPRTEASGNNVGIEAHVTSATLTVTQSTIAGNTTGYTAGSGGAILSYGDNSIEGTGRRPRRRTAQSARGRSARREWSRASRAAPLEPVSHRF
jgi:hypothetical protein